ncbi:hypothetical protein D1AOALGA4SA_10147 [Olavius algarvensis Delta 1 endosymbiont]|nr:hypothetical protein D1AOALGA4SA_10147 [Olavius algarvensis Delta 1 endosymbiont]
MQLSIKIIGRHEFKDKIALYVNQKYFIFYHLKNLCNLGNLWIKCLFACGFAALSGSAAN